MKIWSFGYAYPAKTWPEGVDVYDATQLPDPASLGCLRHLNGTNAAVQGVVLAIPGIDKWLDEIVANPPKVGIAIGCHGGVHRSVSLCEELGRRFNVVPKHLDLAKRAEWKNVPMQDQRPRKRVPGDEKEEGWTTLPTTERPARTAQGKARRQVGLAAARQRRDATVVPALEKAVVSGIHGNTDFDMPAFASEEKYGIKTPVVVGPPRLRKEGKVVDPAKLVKSLRVTAQRITKRK